MTYAATVLADSPIRYYRLGEASGTVATDIGSGAQNGTLTGGVTLGQPSLLVGDSNTALLLNGTSGYISLPTTGLPTGAHPWSIEVLWKVPGTVPTTWQEFFHLGTFSGAAGAGVRVAYSGGEWRIDNVAYSHTVHGATVVANGIYHILATYDGTNVALYVNGDMIGSAPLTLALAYGVAQLGLDEFANYVSGTLDEVAIYNTALPVIRTEAHYLASIAPSSTIGQGAFGLTIYHQNDTDAINPQLLPDMQALGATWLRYCEPWSVIESPQGTYHWASTDRIVAMCQAAHINLIFNIGFPPAWGLDTVACSDGHFYPIAAPWATFASALVARYGNAFQSIEVGNEENSNTSIASSCLNSTWAPVASAVVSALRSGGYTGKIGTTSLIVPYIGGGFGSTYTTDWINYLYAPTNVASLFDYIALHYYTNAESPAFDFSHQGIMNWLTSIRAALAAQGDPNKPLWITEFGWWVRGTFSVIPEATRAGNFMTMYNAWLLNMPHVEKLLFYTMDSFPLNDDNQTITYGMQPSEVFSSTFYAVQAFIRAVQQFVATGTYGVTIGNVTARVLATTLSAKSTVGRRGEMTATVYDPAGANHYQQYQQTALYSPSGALVWSGYLTSPVETKPGFQSLLTTAFTATDQHYLADKRIAAVVYRNKTCGFMVQDMVTNILAAEGVIVGSIAAGPVVPVANFGYVTVAAALDQLVQSASSSGVPYYWMIDQNKVLWFVPYSAVIGPAVDGTTIDDGRLSGLVPTVTRANPLYRNTQYAVGGVQQTPVQDETVQGDGQTRAFPFKYALNQVPSIFTLNGASKSLGVKGQTGYNYYYAVGDPIIAQDPGQTILVSTDRLRMVYIGQIPGVFSAKNAAQITAQAALDGTSGIVEAVLNDSSIGSASDGLARCNQLLTQYCQNGLLFQFATRDNSLQVGMLISVTYAPLGFSGKQMLISEIDASDQKDGINIWYTVNAIAGPYDVTWVEFFGNILKPPKFDIAANISLGIVLPNPLYPQATTLFPQASTLFPG